MLLNLRYGYSPRPSWITSAALRLCKGITTGLGTLALWALPGQCAETIYFDYNIFSRSLPISSLETYAADGSVDHELATYLALMPPEAQAQLQTILNQPLTGLNPDIEDRNFSSFALSQWLYSPIGERVLFDVGKLVQTNARQNSWKALRAAMIFTADDDEELSLINILRQFPAENIRVDLALAQDLARAVQTNVNTTDQLVIDLAQWAQVAAALEPTLNYSALPSLEARAPFDVVKRSLVLTDSARDRTYSVDLYRPDDLSNIEGPIPVMVLSHGYGDTNVDSLEIARSLAANGFVVALPEHIGSSKAYQEALEYGLVDESFEALEFVNRPRDISFLLDTLEQQNAGEFQERLQLDRVGVMGHSFGGYTALATAGATVDVEQLQQQCNPAAEIGPELVNIGLLLQCRLLELESVPGALTALTSGELADERVGLVIAIAPITNLFGSQGMDHLKVPVVMLGGAYDVAAPVILEQVDAFASLTGTDKYFYLGEKISHNLELTRTLFSLLHPGEEAEERVDQSLETSVSIVRTLSIAHGRTYLLGEDSYLPYLTAAYVQAVSTEPAKIHLIRDLPF